MQTYASAVRIDDIIAIFISTLLIQAYICDVLWIKLHYCMWPNLGTFAYEIFLCSLSLIRPFILDWDPKDEFSFSFIGFIRSAPVVIGY